MQHHWDQAGRRGAPGRTVRVGLKEVTRSSSPGLQGTPKAFSRRDVWAEPVPARRSHRRMSRALRVLINERSRAFDIGSSRTRHEALHDVPTDPVHALNGLTNELLVLRQCMSRFGGDGLGPTVMQLSDGQVTAP
jgi:hypothetical protein